MLALPVHAGKYDAVLKQLQSPVGFSISVFADNLPNARSMALADHGVIFIGTRQQGDVYAVRDSNGDGIADKRYLIASKLYMPNGVAYKDGALYVAETNRILRYDNIIDNLAKPPAPVVIYDGFPTDQRHGWKYLRFGPDGKLYTAVGAPCNICNPEQEIYTALVRLNPDGSNLEVLARGIRNSVGFDWHPQTKALFFTENGRDHLGDDAPPDELNRWAGKGQHFGYPYCHAGIIADPELAEGKKCDEFIAPAWQFKAHMAPLGVRFYQGRQFPRHYRDQLFVAQHGSWNRSEPHGYRVAVVKFKDAAPVSEHAFISGWLTDTGKVLGRPVDILELQDGSLLISDDKLGLVYKVEYKR
ncbi:MAG: PQQ-dependent sugar dehydrogenase [Gammaproteobacteria bacterium]